MCDLSANVQTVTDPVEITFLTEVPDRQLALDQPPAWMNKMSPADRQSVRRVSVASLTEHPACQFQPINHQVLAAITASVKRMRILYPLAVAKDGRVLDGRYRLRAAQALGLTEVSVLTIDVDGDAAVEWVFEVKNGREHLNEHQRAMRALAYQKHLSKKQITLRTGKMNAGRKSKSKPGTAEKKAKAKTPKVDSRKEACAKYSVSERAFRDMKKLQGKSPKLYEKAASGEIDTAVALKQLKKDAEKARVQQAKVLNAQPQVVDSTTLENNIHCGDAVEIMKKVADSAASLVLFSPWYHDVPVAYDPPLPKRTYAEYLDYQRQLLAESFRASRRGGRLAVVIDNIRNTESDRHFTWPLVSDFTQLATDCGWSFLDGIAWCKDEISGSKTNFGSLGLCSAPVINRNHETILLFFKETHKLDGDTTLCDLSREEYLQWWPSSWQIKPEVDKELRRQHPAPFPEEIPHRLIKMFTYGRDLVIDPCNGSGTTTAVAKRLGRRYIGIDQSPSYCHFAKSRTAAHAPACAQAKAVNESATVGN